jgi:TM2 domain-containing membrane protein YozV
VSHRSITVGWQALPLLLFGLGIYHPSCIARSAAGTIAQPATVLDTLWASTIPTEGDTVQGENKRWVAAALAVFLGPFGAHRLYLGTTAKVPVIYGITFGGFGVLALIDLGHLLFTKDLSRFGGSDRVFMWASPKQAATPP